MEEVSTRERRAVSRQPGNTVGPIRLFLDKEPFTVAGVWDFSVLGIGVLSPRRLEPGTRLTVRPGETDSSLAPELHAEVRHTSPRDGQEYLLGCQFSRVLTSADVLALS